MKYYTIKLNTEFLKEYIEFRAKWREKYNLTRLAADIGYSVQHLSDIIRGDNKGEISPRLIATMMKVTGASFNELCQIVESTKEANDYKVPSRQNGQTFSINPDDCEKNEYEITAEKKYNALIAGYDFAARQNGKKRPEFFPKNGRNGKHF